jgi:hypothetical protein
MNNTMSTRSRRTSSTKVIAALALTGALSGSLMACSSTTIPSATPPSTATTGAATGTQTGSVADPQPSESASAPAAGSPILPVDKNPIVNTSTVQALVVDSVLVENNVGPDGNDTDDHLEVALSNSGPDELTGFEVFYTFSDPKTGDAESYYVKLPESFTIPAGEKRVAHFDNTGATDHFPVNDFSLYFTDTNALDVTVDVSAAGAAVASATVKKDAGGVEEAD